MQVKYLLFSFLLLLCYGSYGQQLHYNQRPEFLKANSVWALGNYGGINFNNSIPLSIPTGMTTESGCASVADRETGNLLFYSNGNKIWNAHHQLMANGQDLLNNPLESFQCVSIVPVINAPGKYYVFSLNADYVNGSPLNNGSLFYSVVDMSLNKGLGDVVAGQRKIKLSDDTLSSAMIAIPGNCGDVWLMVHTVNSFQFMAYHITKEGIDVTPVVSNDASNTAISRASLAVSPDRQKIAITNGEVTNGTILGRFDAGTGQVSDLFRIGGGTGASTGVCFSPDNSKLYLTFIGRSSALYQYDLSVYNATDISLSGQSIAIPSATGNQFWALKLYNDTIYTYPFSTGISRVLSRINQPNLAGTACGYQVNAITLIGDTVALGASFNNEVVLPLPLNTAHSLALDTIVCSADFKLNAPSGFATYEWEDGSTAPERTITMPGTYWVASNGDCHPRVDTFTIAGVGFKAPVISANVHELSIPATYNSYQWLLNGDLIAGATTNSYKAQKNGGYQVIVTNADGCLDTSVVQEITDIEGNSIVRPETLATQISLYPNPSTTVINITAPVAVNVVLSSIEGRVVQELQQVNRINLNDLIKGVYLLRITDRYGNFIKAEKIVKQ